MKKIIAIMITCSLINIGFSVNAGIEVEKYIYEWNSVEADIPLSKINENCYLFHCNGEDYIYSELSKASPVKYNKREADFFINSFNGLYYCHDYLWTGDYYMARFHRSDAIPQSWNGYTSFPVRLYDQDFNLIKEYNFDKYVYQIDYLDGEYYCYVGNEWLTSNDFQNWTKSDIISIFQTNKIKNINNRISINGSEYYEIMYENNATYNVFRVIGDYIFGNRNGKQCVSLDGIYSVDLPVNYKNGFSGIYFNDKYLIYEGKNKYFGEQEKNVFSIYKADIDLEIAKIKQSPYIKYENQILGLEQPPVIEDDYTLIPIRFLFEQMGADVTWNQVTQTATISQNNTAITFGIDDTEVNVNGETVSMDIPARLINGKTMVPVRFLSEELGYTVDWDGENRIITIK